MSSDEIQTTINDIQKLTQGYRPNERISSELAAKTIVPIIGPFAAGKSTLMKLVGEMDDEFDYALGFTTRAQREGEPDDTYRFFPHTQDKLTQLLEQLKDGELVQANVYDTGYIYGSDLDSFRAKYNIMAVVTAAIANFELLPFGDMVNVYTVVELDQWLARIDTRSQVFAPGEVKKRWQEAHASLSWAVDNADKLTWVENADEHADTAAQEIISIARGKDSFTDNERGLALAHAMLDRAADELAKTTV